MTVASDFTNPSLKLRLALRHRTAHAHERLDEAISALNLKSTKGYSDFLKLQHMALGYCYRFYADAPAALGILPPYPCSAIEADLLRLSEVVPNDWTPQQMIAPPVLGTAYVVAGARLGAKLLIKRVNNAASSVPEDATSFLKEQQDHGPWSRVLRILNSRDIEGSDFDAVIASANRTFLVFNEALDALD